MKRFCSIAVLWFASVLSSIRSSLDTTVGPELPKLSENELEILKSIQEYGILPCVDERYANPYHRHCPPEFARLEEWGYITRTAPERISTVFREMTVQNYTLTRLGESALSFYGQLNKEL